MSYNGNDELGFHPDGLLLYTYALPARSYTISDFDVEGFVSLSPSLFGFIAMTTSTFPHLFC